MLSLFLKIFCKALLAMHWPVYELWAIFPLSIRPFAPQLFEKHFRLGTRLEAIHPQCTRFRLFCAFRINLLRSESTMLRRPLSRPNTQFPEKLRCHYNFPARQTSYNGMYVSLPAASAALVFGVNRIARRWTGIRSLRPKSRCSCQARNGHSPHQ